jgi:hypothetical protein
VLSPTNADGCISAVVDSANVASGLPLTSMMQKRQQGVQSLFLMLTVTLNEIFFTKHLLQTYTISTLLKSKKIG